jgi:hypothetical protein
MMGPQIVRVWLVRNYLRVRRICNVLLSVIVLDIFSIGDCPLEEANQHFSLFLDYQFKCYIMLVQYHCVPYLFIL